MILSLQRLILCLLFSSGIAVAGQSSDPAAPDPASGGTLLAPTQLRSEYLHTPLAIESLAPRLDWQLTAHSPFTRHVTQTAYEIVVATTPQLLLYGRPDLWDSGKVESAETIQIPYSGATLFSREQCYWRVKVWDQNDQESPWSETDSWQMGLLEKADWQARWIQASPLMIWPLQPVRVDYGTPIKHDDHVQKYGKFTFDVGDNSDKSKPSTPPEYGPVPILRKDFDVPDKTIINARLYVTAEGLYEFHLNGARVGNIALAPDWTDYTKRCRYDTYDVTALIKPGKNTLATLLGNGWYCGQIGNGGFQAWGKVPALFGQLEITYEDASRQTIPTDTTWISHPSPIQLSDFMLGENYDARQEVEKWDLPEADLKSWTPVTETTSGPQNISSRVSDPVVETEERKPISLKEVTPGKWVYDLGQNMAGVVRLNFAPKNPIAAAGDMITIRHAEMLNPDGTLYTANLRGALSTDTYVCKGGDSVWQPRFTFHGFRYVELSNLRQTPTLETITGIVEGTKIDGESEFSCSSQPVNQLESNIKWGMRGNYLSVPTDCPQRDERLGWMGDAEIFVPTAAYNGDIASFFTKWLVDVDDAQRADGAFTNISPSPPGKGRANGGTPAWGDAGVICPWTIYQFYGDRRILAENLPAMTRWVEWCRAQSTNLIRDKDRGHDYGDWLAQGETTPKDLIGTAFFAHSTDLLARSYDAVGDTKNAQFYGDLFKQIRQAFIEKYVSPDGHVLGNTQTGYSIALEFDLIPPSQRDAAATLLVRNIQQHTNHLTTGFVGVSHLLPALSHANDNAVADDLLFQQTFPSWLFSVNQGATTIWERWDGWTPDKGFQSPSMNSFNHYSLGSCGEWMFETLSGIQLDPANPGFSHVIIAPVPSHYLTSAHATYLSIRGSISTNWTTKSNAFQLTVTIPANVTATVYLPTKLPSSVLEGGKPPELKLGVDMKPVTDKGVPCEIGSGTYSFSCQLY